MRTVELASFPQAIEVVDRVAEVAERDNHHPDIDIRWRTLTFRCSTHCAGGVTASTWPWPARSTRSSPSSRASCSDSGPCRRSPGQPGFR